MSFTFEWVGVDKASGRIQRIDVGNKVSNATFAAGRQMQIEARDNAPVDTGTLVKSIQSRMSGKFTAIVKAKAAYAGYVEFGTTKQRAQPFFTPAFATASAEYAAELEKILAGA